jgi:hypothetical protein
VNTGARLPLAIIVITATARLLKLPFAIELFIHNGQLNERDGPALMASTEETARSPSLLGGFCAAKQEWQHATK